MPASQSQEEYFRSEGMCAVCHQCICTVCVSCLRVDAHTFGCFSRSTLKLYFSPFVVLLFWLVFSSFCHFCSLLLAYPPTSPHNFPPSPSFNTQIKGMMQTPLLFLMLDPFWASQLASGPWKSRKHLFIADVKTSSSTYAFIIPVKNKIRD